MPLGRRSLYGRLFGTVWRSILGGWQIAAMTEAVAPASATAAPSPVKSSATPATAPAGSAASKIAVTPIPPFVARAILRRSVVNGWRNRSRRWRRKGLRFSAVLAFTRSYFVAWF